MPIYEYKCIHCNRFIECIHDSELLDNPDQKLLEERSCVQDEECIQILKDLNLEQARVPCFFYVPSVFAINKFDSLSSTDKKKFLQRRATEHFNKEIKPIKQDKWGGTFGKGYF